MSTLQHLADLETLFAHPAPEGVHLNAELCTELAEDIARIRFSYVSALNLLAAEVAKNRVFLLEQADASSPGRVVAFPERREYFRVQGETIPLPPRTEILAPGPAGGAA
ncbi:hypothetical protein BA190_27705 [Labrys sp. WJW]|uniref:hypothetical protein n=1 Tax=Labrys sp. WJW TaxID=1737983 RepID=UPI000830779D|nr:hypothetical protein [Labrys sp. WJW]OCC01750.1 hypothetical protein BA190_27705 [Labrys sp. WJW]